MHGPSRVPILFEALPTAAAAGAQARQYHLDRLAPLEDLPLEGLLVPHIEDGEYATIDPRAFARAVADRTGLRPSVAKVTVDSPAEQLHAWLHETRARFGIHDVLLVGGRSHQSVYPGPSVDRSLRLLDGEQASFGVVTIPTRRRPVVDEPHRLLRKLRAGAKYAVSQILFDPEAAIALRREKADALAPGETPGRIYWSLAPVRTRKDIRFLERLGVHIPPDLRQRLWDADGPDEREAIARDAVCQAAATILSAAAREGHGETGFCISHVMDHNIEAAQRLVEAVADTAASLQSSSVRPLAAVGAAG